MATTSPFLFGRQARAVVEAIRSFMVGAAALRQPECYDTATGGRATPARKARYQWKLDLGTRSSVG